MLAIYDEILYVGLEHVDLSQSLVLDLRNERSQASEVIRTYSSELYVETELLIIAASLSHLNDPGDSGSGFAMQFVESLKALYLIKALTPSAQRLFLHQLPECYELALWLVERTRRKVPLGWNLVTHHWGYAGQVADATVFSPVCENHSPFA